MKATYRVKRHYQCFDWVDVEAESHDEAEKKSESMTFTRSDEVFDIDKVTVQMQPTKERPYDL